MKRFGYTFWKDSAEVMGYAMISLGLMSNVSTKGVGIIGFSFICFYFLMMIIEEFKR